MVKVTSSPRAHLITDIYILHIYYIYYIYYTAALQVTYSTYTTTTMASKRPKTPIRQLSNYQKEWAELHGTPPHVEEEKEEDDANSDGSSVVD